jgi:glycosyltransferase involved in cell wall biosynthesis
MRTAALAFAGTVEARKPDLLLASDYLNLAELMALLGSRPPAVVYFHENQLSYPLQATERRDVHFGLTHLYSVLCSRAALFNSDYHRRSFLGELGSLLKQVPDVDTMRAMEGVEARSSVIPLGTEVERRMPSTISRTGPPVILWANRWEYDKDPEGFVSTVTALAIEGAEFRVRVLGERFREQPENLRRLQEVLGERLLSARFADTREEYLRAVDECDIVFSTARHEFFGLATLEALRRGLLPVLPRDLAYPELLPIQLREDERFLYPRGQDPAGFLRRALEAVQREEWRADRDLISSNTDRFHWSRVAPRFDEALRAAVAPD